MNKNNIMVSICCITYNHEDYIRKALEGFLMQKTNFKYEIIIHDDASTDETANIIREYEEKYPDIIKPIYQKENQHSKKIKILPIVFEKATGKYSALCEGDDYWCDDSKLQRQVDIMEADNNISLCFHDSKILSDKENIDDNFLCKKNCDCIIPTENLILGGGLFCATASLMFKTVYAKKLPEYYYKSNVGDYPLQLYLASKGKVYFINKKMSIYRMMFNNNSWTANYNKSLEKRIENSKNEILWLESFNKVTNFKYKDSIYEKICSDYIDLISMTDEKFKYFKLYRKYFKKIKSKRNLKNNVLILKVLIPKRIKKILKIILKRGC